MSDPIDRQAAIDALKPCAGVGNRALDKLRALPSAEPRWTPCSERFPEAGQMVLGTNKYGYVWVFKRIENGWSEPDEGWFTDEEEPDHVKAWMPLPEPYKEDEE